MEIDLGHVEDRETFTLSQRFRISSREESGTDCRVTVVAAVSRIGNRYILEAPVKGVVKAICSRCLEPFEYEIDTSFQLVFQRGENVQMPGDLTKDDFIVLTNAGEYCYDIFPRVKEAVLLELPIKYLCGPECRGICPGCGANLNLEPCRCELRKADPRWGPLKKLLNEQDED